MNLFERVPWIETTCAVCGVAPARTLFEVHDQPAHGPRHAIVSCVRCGLARPNLRPSEGAVGELYEDDYYAYAGRLRGPVKQRAWDALRNWSSRPAAEARGIGAAMRRVARWRFDVNVTLDGRRRRIVDVGCGSGDLLLYFTQRGCEVLGVELDERAARAAQELGVPVETRPLAVVGLPPASVDVVIFQHSLEHLADPDAELAEVARVLRTGGEVHIAVPNGASAGFRREREYWGALFHPEHFWYFDVASLRALLERHGLVIRSASTTAIWTNHGKLLFAALRGQAPRPAAARALATLPIAGRSMCGDVLRIVAARL